MQSPKCNAVDVSCIVFCVLCFVCACLCQHACRATAFAFQPNQRQIPTWIYVDTSLRTTSLKLTARLCRPREPYNNGTLEVLASRRLKTLISYAQKIILTTDTLQSSLLEALGSVLRRLRSISEHSECTCVCVRVCVSKHEMQQLVLLQQLVEECGLQSAMR